MRVLHVDDDPNITELSATRLERECEDVTVETATNPADGLDRFAEGDIDCVVSDYQMPECNGIEFLRRIRDLDEDVPFILFTGHGNESIASEAIAADVTGYLRKGTGADRFKVLAARIEQAIDGYRAEERFEAFLQSVPDATCIVDEDGIVTTVNRQLEELFGYDRSEIVGERVEMLLPERDREQHVHYREAFMSDPARRPMGASFDLYALRSDGTEFPVDVSLSPIRIGGHVEVMAAIRDATERRRRQRRVERQNDRLEEFVDVVAHDLRNPLQVATGRLELARETGDLDHLDGVSRNHERMENLIDNLLTLAQQGEVVGEPESVDLAATVERVWQNVETGDSSLEVEGDLGEVAADQSRLFELFENLFRNAVEHGSTSSQPPADDGVERGSAGDRSETDDGVERGSTGGRPAADDSGDRAGADVHIRVGALDGGFYVEDDGPGVPEHERDEVFERGFTTSGDGTGLGLAIVRRVVEAHGWDVDVTEGRDGGARFEIATGRDADLLYAE